MLLITKASGTEAKEEVLLSRFPLRTVKEVSRRASG